MMEIIYERLSDEFQKWKLIWTGDGKKYFHAVLHHFTGADKGEPHSHPWNFTSFVLADGYLEREYVIHSDGSHTVKMHERKLGTVHEVRTNTVHEIVSLPDGEAWTIVIPTSPAPVPWHFWRFDESGIWKRLPEEEFFSPHKPLSNETATTPLH